jgi:hypothetical protein
VFFENQFVWQFMTGKQLIQLLPSNLHIQDIGNLKIFDFIRQHSLLFKSNINWRRFLFMPDRNISIWPVPTVQPKTKPHSFFYSMEITRKFSLSELTVMVGCRIGQDTTNTGITNDLLSLQAKMDCGTEVGMPNI